MRAPAVLAFLIVVLASSLVIGWFWADQRLSEKDRMVDYLLSDVDQMRTDNTRLGEENAQLSREIESLSVQVDTLKADVATAKKEADATLVPQEIGSNADFPIERGMAKGGESVETFAKREGTSIEVLRALNPWLDPKQPLKKFQTLWLPIK
ncbi:MAG: LysM peptidoglycan-binding domain-containing protein [Rhodospirillum sp.]|nr:LysM peptidoglycan-binding domain-containing protein [Rhodospirillum sp.]MCF8490260.1 LysM peptidoglycan-binding domain-containing protein [Rhodospirillum sp.]MCF8499369.1 LysM peptidoglycan-binding domain-containing protein [Rhodospirillum sp.]